MAAWRNKIQLKHLFTDEEDYKSVQVVMNAVADKLDKAPFFRDFSDRKKFRAIPRGDEFFSPVDYANRLLDMMYDYADSHQIWIE